jgi:hypothetical protein
MGEMQMGPTFFGAVSVVFLAFATTALPCIGQQQSAPTTVATPPPAANQAQELAKQLQNPIANLISFPIQNNFDFKVGPDNGFRYTGNIQPVVPISLSSKWIVISRTILPVVHQSDVIAPPIDNTDIGAESDVYGGSGEQTGLGDLTQSFFFSPKKPLPGGVIFGIGPAILVPTATDKYLGSGKWGMGPTTVALKQSGPWTVGMLFNYIASFAGQSAKSDVSSTFLQPFVSYTFKNTTSIAFNTESTFDFETSTWTTPLNLTIGKLYRFGRQPVNLTIGGKYYATGPAGAPEWGLRFVTTFLFPAH